MVENVADLMAFGLPSLAAARSVGFAAEAIGLQPFLVGGSVRDMLMDRPGVVDLDIALVGADSETFDRIASLTGGTVSKLSQFTTAKLSIDDLEVDLAMARAEEYPTSGSLPIVRPGTLEEDLARRDFSVNAMAISLSSDDWGDLYDNHTGVADLEKQRLRVLYKGSFRDDPTRILRAARYMSRLHLKPTTETIDELNGSVKYLNEVSPARVRNELERVFAESDPDAAFRSLREWGVLAAIHPSLGEPSDAWRSFVAKTGDLPHRSQVNVGYAVLACGLSAAAANGVIVRLRPDSAACRAIRESALLSRTALSDLLDCSNSQLARLLDPLTASAVLGASLTTGDESGRRLAEYLEYHRRLRPNLSGNDLIALGVQQGPTVGHILERLRNAWLDGEVSNADGELELAKKLINRSRED